MSETIGFIGLGRLGIVLANNLLDAGYAIRVYNRTASKADPLVAKGAQLANKPVDAVIRGGVVASIVWDDAALEDIVMSEGFLEKLGAGSVHIVMSTVLPETSKKMAALHAEHGCAYVEAPIFGVPEAAAAKTLLMPIAGAAQAKERVRPLLEAMGANRIFDFGEQIGAAVLVKIIGNYLIVSAGFSMREGLKLAEANGVDQKAVVNMLTTTLFAAPIYQSYGKRIAENATAFGQSPIPLKDVGLFRANAQHVEAVVPLAGFLLEMLKGETAKA